MKKKFFSIICLFCLITVVLINNVKASNLTCKEMVCPKGDCTKTLDVYYPAGVSNFACSNSDGKHFGSCIILKYDGIYYAFVTCNYDDVHGQEKFYRDNEGRLICNIEPYNYAFYEYSETKKTWTYKTYVVGAYNYGDVDWAVNVFNNCEYISSTCTIYTDSNYTDVFFCKHPTTLEEIMRVEADKKATIQEVLGVLPLILVVVVSFLGLRKALSWLSTLLRRS